MNTEENSRASPNVAERDEDARDLWIAFKRHGSPAAREALFSNYFAHSQRIARRQFRDRSGADIEFPDLCQLASAGLLEAIDRFNPELGVPFLAYASRRIKGSILDGIAKSNELREQISSRQRARRERARSLAGTLSDDMPIATAMQALTELTIGLALGFMLEGTNLYVNDDQPAGDMNAYDSVAWKETVGQVLGEVARLPDRERAVVRHHYINGLTFEQVGALLGVSKGRVSQLHKSAIEQLRRRLPTGANFRLER